MKGLVQIINNNNHMGKILLDDGRESYLIKFPTSFQSGDNINVKFKNDDPSDKILHYSVLSNDWYYGFIMIPH